MGITLREAAEILDPVMTAPQVGALALIAGIKPSGRRHTGRPGHPADEYSEDAIRRAHAQEAARTAKQFTDNDWLAHALLSRQLLRADIEAGSLWWPDGTRAEELMASLYGCVRVKQQQVGAHRVIWIAAEGEIPPAMQINHRNRLKWDNRRANLELVSHGENVRHAYGQPYVTYHQAVTQLAMLPPPIPRAVPEPASGLQRAGGAFILTGN